ncbi:MAG: hypothetical protein AAF684_07120 [Pseudomonadota bacterium]
MNRRVDRDRIRGLRGRRDEQEPDRPGSVRTPTERGDAIIEFVSRGAYVRVCAVDVETGVEAAIVGDPQVGEDALKRIALQKLDYVIRTRRRGL